MEYLNASFVLTKEELNSFFEKMREQGASTEKLRRTKYRLQCFYDDLPERKVVTASVLRSWRKRMNESGMSPRTIEGYVTSVNMLLRDMGHRELCFTQGRQADLTNRVFGRLTAIEQVRERRAPNRSVYWRCRCTCGKEIEAPANQLLKGSYQSCGCLKLEQLQDANGYIDNTCLRMVLSDTVRSDNTSGYPGVYRKKDTWAARIQYKGKIYALGCYTKIEDAIRARKEAEAWVKDDAERLLMELNSRTKVAAV